MDAKNFNNLYPIGTQVRYGAIKTKTRSFAHDVDIIKKAFVYLEGFYCPVDLKKLEVSL